MEIKNLSAFVTGGASGLGAATASALISAGARVALFDLNEEGVKKTAAEIGALGIHGDVTDEHSVKNALAAATTKNGPIRILVNCAGIGTFGRIVGKTGPMSLEYFEKIIRVNLIGSFNTMRLVAEQMIASVPVNDSERGVIISTASVAAFEGQIGQAAYSASKGGIVSMTLPAAREFAQFGIRVNTVAPGMFETPLLKELSEEAKQSLTSSIPFPKRLGMADEFAKLVVHVVSNSYINGEVIRIDGALRMQSK